MTRFRAAVALCCGALVLLPGCGSKSNGPPIPTATADRLVKNIQAADAYSAGGHCERAHTKVRDARFVLTQVPDNVKTDVKQGIADGLAHLDSLISSQCQAPTNTQTDTTPTDTTPTDTTPTVTQTTTTQTQTQTQTTPTQTQTTPTSTVPTSTTPAPTGTSTSPGNGGTPTSTGATGGTEGTG